jgi:hypothetical protein
MRSFWGPGVDHLDQHLEITMRYEGNGQQRRQVVIKEQKEYLVI